MGSAGLAFHLKPVDSDDAGNLLEIGRDLSQLLSISHGDLKLANRLAIFCGAGLNVQDIYTSSRKGLCHRFE
jgi:hypothetical protein